MKDLGSVESLVEQEHSHANPRGGDLLEQRPQRLQRPVRLGCGQGQGVTATLLDNHRGGVDEEASGAGLALAVDDAARRAGTVVATPVRVDGDDESLPGRMWDQRPEAVAEGGGERGRVRQL